MTLPAASVSRKSVHKLRFNNAKKEASAGVAGFAVFSRWSFGISYLRQLPDFEAHISS
jgi:hypothetical protein